jgi:hypothetical protein
MARIYVSSTFSDLEEYRKQVSLALRRLGHEEVTMDYYVVEDRHPLDRCLSDVASCDVYVGIFAWRCGYVPQEDNPECLSIAELETDHTVKPAFRPQKSSRIDSILQSVEYRKAQENGIPCLIFLLPEEAPWPKIKQDKDAAGDRIESLRQDLSKRHVVDFSQNADELTRKVHEAAIKWEKESGLSGFA